MKHIVLRLILFIGALTAIAASALWAAFWWRWVAREYDLAPTGSNNLERAIVNEVGGTVFVGFAVFWLFRRIACVFRKTTPPDVSPLDVARYLAPSMPKVDPASNQAMTYLWVRSTIKEAMTNAAYRLGRLLRLIRSRQSDVD